MAEAAQLPASPDDEIASSGSLSTQDDFELISDHDHDHSLVEPAEKFSFVNNEYLSRGDDDRENQAAGPVRVMDPLEAFEMIQSEHRLLKDELLSQSQLLRKRLASVEGQDSRHNEEVAALKKRIDDLSEELSEAKIYQVELQLKLEAQQKNSEKMNSTLNCPVEMKGLPMNVADTVQDESENTPNSTSVSNLVSDEMNENDEQMKEKDEEMKEKDEQMKEKDEQVKELRTALIAMENALGSLHRAHTIAQEDMERMKLMNSELRELVTDLQNQNEMDKAEWAAIRVDLEQRIEMLSYQLSTLGHQMSADPFGPGREFSVYPSLPHEDSEQPQPQRLGHTDSHMVGSDGKYAYTFCPRCHLPMASAGPHPCPSIIDALD